MSLNKPSHMGWQQFLNALLPDERQHLLNILGEEQDRECIATARLVGQTACPAYPHIRTRLQRIAHEEKTHVQWLRDCILDLGGAVPQVSCSVKSGKHGWERTLIEIEHEKRECMRLIEHLTALGPANSEIAEELERIREEERWHQEEILDMLEENDPYALAYATSQPEVLIRQKNLWLEQQKSEWLARRRAVWEAKGKPISWDTWLDEREYEWATRELPDREAEWTRRLLEQDAHTRR